MSYQRVTYLLNCLAQRILPGSVRLTTYAMRRFLPSLALSLKIPEEDRNALGNWLDCVGSGRQTEPMNIRYSDTRLERSSDVKRSILAALNHACWHVPDATHETLSQCAKYMNTFSDVVLLLQWGQSNASEVTALPAPPLPVNEPEAHQQSSVSSSDSSSEASLHKDAPEENIDEIRWILPKGPKSLLHIRSEEGDGVPLCRKSAFAWGFTE
eukprot:6460955-Amphidinium_carterae.1